MRGLIVVLAAAVAVLGCGGSSNPGHQDAGVACIVPDATYLESFTPVSGNCVPIGPQLVSSGPGGTTTNGAPVSCSSESESGCTVLKTDCTWTSLGYSYVGTSTLTFAPDGSSGVGTASINSNSGCFSCTETYNVSVARQ